MKFIIFVFFINFGLAAISNAFVGKAETTTCIDYSKPQDIHSTHYWDGTIHLVPMFSGNGKDFKGFVIVHLSKNNSYISRGLQVGDIITEVDGIKPKATLDLKENAQFFEKLKSHKAKSIQLERCQKINLQS